MGIENYILQYGVLAVWVVVLLRQQHIYDTAFRQLIEANTRATIENNTYLTENKSVLECIKDILKTKKGGM